MRRISPLLLLSLAFVPGPLASQDEGATIDAVADVIAEQAAAWNRGDLDGSMAILTEDADWRTIDRELLTGKDQIREAYRGWMESTAAAGGYRMTYPAEGVRIRLLGSDVAVADVVLIWELPPPTPGAERREIQETLFFVLRRENEDWRLAHVRNTTNAGAG